MKGIKVSGHIRPISLIDQYPTHLDNLGKGGIHSITSILNRNAITVERRSEGMFTFTQDNQTMYFLVGGIDNSNWRKLFDFTDNKINFNIACDTNYVLLGNKDGIAKPSPVLLDVRQDIIDLRRHLDRFERLDKLDYNRIWIGDYNNEPIERVNIGVINLPTLGAATFPYPSIIPLPPVAIPNPTFNPFSGFDWLMSGPWLPQIFAGSANTTNTSSETVISSSLAMTQVKVAQAIKRLDVTGFIVKTKTIDFAWENPAMLLIPEPIKQLYGLGASYTFTQAQALDELNDGILYNRQGVLSQAIAGKDYVDVSASINNMQLALIRPYAQDEQGNDIAKLLTRVSKLPEDNMPDLTFIMQHPNAKIPSAQGLSDLAGGILKSAALTGKISIASGGGTVGIDDYVTPAVLTEEIEAVLAEATEAATVAGAEAGATAGATAGTASGAIAGAEAGATAGATAGGIAGGTAGTAAATLVLFTKESTSDHNADISAVNTRIDNLHIPPSNAKYILNQQASGLSQAQVLSDLIGINYPNGGLLKVTSIDGIIKIASPTVDYADPNKENTFLEKINFQKDVQFLSKGAIKIPTGTIIQRPSNPEAGMFRYNIEI